MAFTNFNPPFTNTKLEDFFGFDNLNKNMAEYIRAWLNENYSQLSEKLKYHVPFYVLGKKDIFYLHYFEIDKKLELEMSFISGGKMFDSHNLFQAKNSKTKSIHITSTDLEFLKILSEYIKQAIEITK